MVTSLSLSLYYSEEDLTVVGSDFNVLKDCKMRGHGGSTLASNDGRRRLFRAGIKLSGPSTQPLPKIGPNLIDDLGLPVLTT